MRSALYTGCVRHRRARPEHEFRRRLCMLYLDLEELDEVFEGRWLWSTRRPAPVRFRRGDHLGDPDRPLADCARDLVEERTGHRPAGRVALLTQLRYWGYGFNPVSFYYLYADSEDREPGSLEAVVADVTNTPWKERHAYVLDLRSSHARLRRAEVPKELHVSPFQELERSYRFRLSVPGRQLGVHITSEQAGRPVFDASLRLQRRAITGRALARALLRQPFASQSVTLGIHVEALKLWWKGAGFVPHPGSRPASPDRAAA